MLRACLLSLTLLLGHSFAQRVPIALDLSANSVTPGENLTVSCTASSNEADRALFINGEFASLRIGSDRLSTESVGAVTTWTIDPVLPEDAGLYLCVAALDSTTDSNSVPQTLVYYYASAPHSIKINGPFIAWNVPSALNGSVVRYRLKVSLSPTNYTVMVARTTYHMLSKGNIPFNLQGASVVTVQIRAVTENGIGEWSSEEVVPVTALAVADLIPALSDLETPRMSLIQDSPIISGRNVTFHLATNVNVSEIRCRLAAHSRMNLTEHLRIFHDCSSGSITYTGLVDGGYTFHAQAEPLAGGEKIKLQRKFRPDNRVECAAHLVNNGLTVSGSSAIVEFDYFADYTRCKLDDESQFRDCSSPYLLTDLSPGEHSFKIVPLHCVKAFRHPVKVFFETT